LVPALSTAPGQAIRIVRADWTKRQGAASSARLGRTASSPLRETLDDLAATAQRRAAAAAPPGSPAEMLELLRSLSGATLPG
jgi:hypothetical protein